MISRVKVRNLPKSSKFRGKNEDDVSNVVWKHILRKKYMYTSIFKNIGVEK